VVAVLSTVVLNNLSFGCTRARDKLPVDACGYCECNVSFFIFIQKKKKKKKKRDDACKYC